MSTIDLGTSDLVTATLTNNRHTRRNVTGIIYDGQTYRLEGRTFVVVASAYYVIPFSHESCFLTRFPFRALPYVIQYRVEPKG
jgi:hypothetical protein